MDFRLFFSVLRRFKLIVAMGFVLACALAFLSFVKVGANGLRYRQQVTWVNGARVLVTSPAKGQDPVALAEIYAELATSDQVAKAAIQTHGIAGTLQAISGYLNKQSTALPTISVSAVAATPAHSALLANDAIAALSDFVNKQQAASGVPLALRANLQPLNRASPLTAHVFTPRSKTPPVVVFVLIIAATIGLAFVLENVRPRVRAVPAEIDVSRAGAEARHARNQA